MVGPELLQSAGPSAGCTTSRQREGGIGVEPALEPERSSASIPRAPPRWPPMIARDCPSVISVPVYTLGVASVNKEAESAVTVRREVLPAASRVVIDRNAPRSPTRALGVGTVGREKDALRFQS